MANELNTVFETQWSNDVKHQFQENKSILREAVRVVNGVNGATHAFHKLNAVTAVDPSALGANHAGIAAVHTTVSATLADKVAPIYLKKFDMQKVLANGDMRREYVQAGSGAINRVCDDAIVAALDASSTALVTGSGSDGFTYAKFLEAIKVMNEGSVDMDERFLIVAPSQVNDMFGITEFKSNDYKGTLHEINNGKVGTLLGVKVLMSKRLSVDTNVRDCYLIQKNAVGLAVGQDLETEISWVPSMSQYLANSSSSMGAVTIEAAGVIQIPCLEA